MLPVNRLLVGRWEHSDGYLLVLVSTWDKPCIIRNIHALPRDVQGGRMDGLLGSTQRDL